MLDVNREPARLSRDYVMRQPVAWATSSKAHLVFKRARATLTIDKPFLVLEREMRLSDFIRENQEIIVQRWERFAASINNAPSNMDKKELRDHAALMLEAIADDLDMAQSRLMQTRKSKGLGPRGRDETAAEAHGGDRLAWGFTTVDMFAEFRALRASVIRLWEDENPQLDRADMVRFNEAIDQAVAESLTTYARENEERESMLYSLLRYSFDHNYIMATDGTLQYVNRAMANAYQKRPAEMIGKHIEEFDPVLAAALGSWVRGGSAKPGDKECRGDMTRKDSDGKEHVMEYRCAPITGDSGETIAYVGITRDVTHRAESERTLWRQANFDPLTNTPNRRLFFDRLDHDIKQAKRNGTRLALLYIDLDKFKAANDRLGHSLGDLLLQQVAQRIASCIRETDTLARLGGDEFTVLLTNLDDEDQAALLASAILEELARPFSLEDDAARISGSIGIALFPEDGVTVDALASNADSAMYAAKKDGGSSYSFYDPTIQQLNNRAGRHSRQGLSH